MNCDHCHINLAWAVANRALFEVVDKQRELDPSRADASPPGDMEVGQQNNRGRIIFTIVIVLMVFLSLRADSLWIVVALLLFGAWFWFIESDERTRAKELEAIWSRLALQIGLTYVASKRSFLSLTSPRVFGEYRGRFVSITLEIEDGSSEYDTARVFTKITLQVINRTYVSLEIKEKGLLTRRAGKREILSGNNEFDRRFRVIGIPPEFAQRVLRLPDLQSILLRDESQNKMMKTAFALSWASSSRPTLTLKDWDLVCLVHGVLTVVDAQIALLNMLCDLADLAEQSGSDSADSDWMD